MEIKLFNGLVTWKPLATLTALFYVALGFALCEWIGG